MIGFQVKICGITRPHDARIAVRAGADAVGLNFYAKSARSVDSAKAQAIVRLLPSDVVKVGVFVNAPAAEVCRIFDEVGLDLVQLHGDEPSAFLARLGARPVIRAFRPREAGLKPLSIYLAECRERGCLPAAVLLDSHVQGAYGGTGRVADWSLANQYAGEHPAQAWHPPLVLAGGLNPGNVAGAIRAVGPAAVDTASGVESSPGCKEASLVRAFVAAAREAFGVSPPELAD